MGGLPADYPGYQRCLTKKLQKSLKRLGMLSYQEPGLTVSENVK